MAARENVSIFAVSLACVTIAGCTRARPEDSRAPPAPFAHASVAPLVTDASATASLDVPPPPPEIVASFQLSPFYRKYRDVHGMPVLGSERVSPFAILEAVYLVEHEIGNRPEILEAIGSQHVRLVVMATAEMTTDIPEHADLTPRAYWNRRARGLGATLVRPAISGAEENLLDLAGDPYATENILIHELAHTIHEIGLAKVDPTFDGRLTAAYENARAQGLWRGTYASTNRMEYWAEATQSWFDCNRANDSEHGPIDTREKVKGYDAPITALLTEVYGDGPWRYTKPSKRAPSERIHLAGFDPATAPTFAWPASAPLRGSDAKSLALVPIASAPRASTPGRSAETSLQFVNERSDEVTLYWLTPKGERKPYATLRPGRQHTQSTYVGHAWVVTASSGDLGVVVATEEAGKVDIR